MGLPDASVENREFIFPSRDGDGCELLAKHCRGGTVAKVTGDQALNFVLTLLSPLWMNGEMNEHPARYFADC